MRVPGRPAHPVIHRPRRARETDFLVFIVCSEHLDENTLGRKFSPAQGGHMHKPGNILVYGEETTNTLCCSTTLFLNTALLNHPGPDGWELSNS